MGTDLIQEFATCRETLLILDRHLQSLQEPPSWTLKGRRLQPNPPYLLVQ